MKVTAAIVDGRRINIVCEGARSVTGIDVMTPEEAVLLARSLLSCAGGIRRELSSCEHTNQRRSPTAHKMDHGYIACNWRGRVDRAHSGRSA